MKKALDEGRVDRETDEERMKDITMESRKSLFSLYVEALTTPNPEEAESAIEELELIREEIREDGINPLTEGYVSALCHVLRFMPEIGRTLRATQILKDMPEAGTWQ